MICTEQLSAPSVCRSVVVLSGCVHYAVVSFLLTRLTTFMDVNFIYFLFFRRC